MLITFTVRSQTTDDIKKEADGLFDKEQFVQATPLYLQLLNVEPRNHELNFKYGACLIYSAQDKSESIRFLNFSVKSASINPLAHYYLGKAYHLNFQFTKAITSYTKFKSVGSQSDQKKFNVDANINACKNGKQLLTNITDMIVMNKTEVKQQDFYELYKLNNIGGSLLVTDIFQTKIDKKLGHRPIIYFPDNSPYIFYSSYGENGNTGLDIYVKQKLPNGKWSEAVKVVGDVNTDLDENYPFLSLDGKYLYYSSKGHNSMGGYDVFRSKVIVEGSSFSKPENMDFAVSSPNDDILYIVDSLDRTAYFSSARESQNGKLYVYEVRVEKIPMQLAVLKGEFVNEIDPGNKSIKVEVINFATGTSVGTYNSSPGSGSILMTIPKSGKYTFEMTVKGNSVTHRAEVSIPYIKEFRPLKVDLIHKLNNEQEVIVLKTRFDDKFDDPTAIMANVYQKISKLDPNSNKYDIDSLNKLRNSDAIFAEAGIDKYSTREDIQELLSKATTNNTDSKAALEINSFIAHNMAASKQTQAEKKLAEANRLSQEAVESSDPNSQKSLFTNAYKLTEEAKKLNKEASVFVNLGEKLETEIKQKDKDIVSLNSALLAAKALGESDGQALNEYVEKNTAVLSLASETDVNVDVLEKIEAEGNVKRKELNKISEKLDDLSDREDAIKTNIENTESKILNTKKKKELEALELQKQSSESELELIVNEIDKYKTKQEKFGENDISTIALVDAVSQIKSENNYSEENTAAISNTQKLKIKYSVDDQAFITELNALETILADNDISGESIDLTNLNQSTVIPVKYKTVAQAEARIEEVLIELSSATDESKKAALQDELAELNKIKEEKIKEESVAIKPILKSDLISDFNEQQSKIVAIKNIEKQKAAQAKLNSLVIKSANKRKDQLEDINNLSIQEENEISQLENIISSAEKELNDYENWKEAVKNKENSADFTYEDALMSSNSEYEEKLSDIQSSDLTDEEKTEELRVLNTTTLSNAKEKLQEAEARLSSDPENELAVKEKRQYSRLVSELETTGAIPLIDPISKESPATVSTKTGKDELLSNYNSSLSKIENSAINDLDKEKAKLNINSQLFTRINSEIQSINSNSNASKSKEGKNALNELAKLKTEIENEIASSKAIIDKKVEDDPSLANSVESIAVNYTTNSYQINELSTDSEKSEAIKQLNEKAVKAIEAEIKKTKIANATNPREELQYEIQELQTIKKELEVNSDKDYYGVVTLDSEVNLKEVKGGTSIQEIDPEFNLKIETISEDAISQKDLERRKIDLFESTLAKTNREIRRVQNGIKSFPENEKQLKKRKESLEEIKEILEDKLFESKAISGESAIAFAISVDVQDANPNYLERVNEIAKINDEREKEAAVVTLNNETVELIEEKISVIKADMNSNGRDSKKVSLIQKYNQLIAEIEANPQLPAKGSVEFGGNSNISQIDNEKSTEFPVIYKTVDINEAIPTYKNEIDSITNAVMPLRDKETLKIELYERSINQLELQAKELETYSRINSPNKEYAEEKLKNIKTIIEVLNEERNVSNEKLVNVLNPQIFVGISDIMPDFETRKEKIEYENSTVIDKLQKTNELNNVLIFEIENKINELEAAQKEEFSLTRSENIEKLNELLGAVNEDVEATNAIIKESEQEVELVESGENKFEPLNPNNFKEDLEVSKLNLIKKDVKLVKTFEKDIARLNRKKARLSGNDAAKVQKEIDKTIAKQSTIQNRLITDLEGVIDEKLWTELSASKENSIKLKGASMYSEEIRNAEEGILIAEAKIERAKKYRREAATIKNQVVANTVLQKAAHLEYDAQQILESSNATLTTAAIVSELTISDPIIVDVDPSVENRSSSSLYKLSNDIERRAFAAEDRVSQLSDTLLRVKKKYRDAILLEIEQVKAEENRLLAKADDIRLKADEVAQQEKELLLVKPNSPKKDIPKTEQLLALKSQTYSDYYQEYSNAESKINEANEIQNKIDELKKEVSKIVRKAIVLDNGVTMEDHQSNPKIIALLSEIDDLSNSQNLLKKEAITNYKNASQILNTSSLNDNTKESIVAMVQRGILPETKVELTAIDVANTATAPVISQPNINEVQNNQNSNITPQGQPVETNEPILAEASSDFIPPNKLDGQLFRITESAVYSVTNPIPVNGSQPEGLVYKVQVGAFRNPLPPETFSKFAPISGEELNSGVTRYMVGYFTNFSPANTAKSDIRNINGYGDAFVVAYFNGEKITISRAKELEEDGVIPGNVSITASNQEVDTPPKNQSNTAVIQAQNSLENQTNTVVNSSTQPVYDISKQNVIEPVTSIDRSKIEYYTSVPDAAEASQVEIINGLFYTVQIGVYSKPVPSSELFNVTPLNSQLTKSGKVRYSTGIYTQIDEAIKRKNDLINTGIVDAFVTAYYNGDRISIIESKKLVSDNGPSVLATGKTISEVAGVPASRFSKENVYYRILIGKYESTVPSNVANYLFNDDGIFFETEIDVENTIYLYTQKFYSLSEVKKGLKEINELGFENMEILSYYNIQTIPFNEAQKIVDNEPIDKLTELEAPEGINADKLFFEPEAIFYKVIITVGDETVSIKRRAEAGTTYQFSESVGPDGVGIITSKKLDSFAEAGELIKKLNTIGVISTRVEAYHKQSQINLNKAQELKGR